MRCLNVNSLKKYFEKKQENITTYLVVIPNSYEKEKFINFILKKINLKNFNLSRFSKNFKIADIINTFQSPSFLGGEPLIVIDEVDELLKADIQKLNDFIKNNQVHLVLGASLKTNLIALYATIEKKGLVFDLTLEKIWEKEKRIANFLVEKCIKTKKNIASTVIEALFEKVGLDLASLEQEIFKLLTFTADKQSIELEDVHKICPFSLSESIWQKAEEIVWGKITFDNTVLDANFFHALISAIRYQLQLGYKIASLLESKKTQDISFYFPKIYPKTLEKKMKIAAIYKTTFYKKALLELFKIDLLSKTVNFNFSYLLNLLKTKLLYLSSYDVNSIT